MEERKEVTLLDVAEFIGVKNDYLNVLKKDQIVERFYRLVKKKI